MGKKDEKNNPGTAVGIYNPENLPSAQDALGVLKAELAKLKAITESSYKVAGSNQLEGFGDITTQKDVTVLIKAMSSVEGRENAYYAAAEGRLKASLGEQVPVFKICGGTADDWGQDINLRITVIKYEDRKNELQALVKEAETFLTEKDKYAMFLKRLEAAAEKGK